MKDTCFSPNTAVVLTALSGIGAMASLMLLAFAAHVLSKKFCPPVAERRARGRRERMDAREMGFFANNRQENIEITVAEIVLPSPRMSL